MKITNISIILSICSIGLVVMDYYINDTPHCHMLDTSTYTCDILASTSQKQKICAYTAVLNSELSGMNVTENFSKEIWGVCARQ